MVEQMSSILEVQPPKEHVVALSRDNFLQMIRSAAIGDNRTFGVFWAKVNGEKKDIVQGGDKACAYFVSTILKSFDFEPLCLYPIGERPHLTVDNTIKAMRKADWKEINGMNIRPGCVVIWKPVGFDDGTVHKHIGFYIGCRQAVSTSSEQGRIIKHDLTFKGKRDIEEIFFNPRLGF